MMLHRYALSGGIAVALLTACGGSQPPIGAPSAILQTSTPTAHADRGRPWMLPEAKSGDLIYATGGCGGTCVISYPGLKLVGEIATNGNGICSDSQGNIFIPGSQGVIEYAHGGTQPIASLTLGGSGQGCSIDPKTNNLAVTCFCGSGDLAVYANEQGNPTFYSTGITAQYCGYDENGNLYIDGLNGYYMLAVLPAGSSELRTYKLDNSVGVPGQVQYDGEYITYQGQDKDYVSRIAIAGSQAKVVSTVTLKGIQHRQYESWIYNGKIIVPFDTHQERPTVVGVWRYPHGGYATGSIRRFGSYKKRETWFWGVTLSVAPKAR